MIPASQTSQSYQTLGSMLLTIRSAKLFTEPFPRVLMPDIRRFRDKIKPSQINRGDGMSPGTLK